ncbi:MAG TPA: tyrosine--tRNA ligase [Deltaproteobacteria bacterium]|nr:tyrosine--tRNA ligase [Deltaproteobacteria bacterium]
MDVYEVLQQRGFLKQCTHPGEVREALSQGEVTFYVGFDPTAASLHVGSLLQIMAMAWLQRLGHRVLALVGGGTARVGDPSGRSELRQMLSDAQIDANSEGIRTQISHFLELDGERGQLVDNADWLLKLQYIPFLRDIGRQFSVNRMLAAEAYKQRLERGLSFIEFNYQILQAYDFLELYRRHGCRLQLGGDDQWGNIVAGVDLVRRMESAEVWGLTTPLLTTATGAKMGKTAQGAIWLDGERLAPFDYWQYWYNCHDDDVGRFLRLYTFLDEEEIVRLEALSGKEIRDAKRVLADETTRLLHGDAAAAAASGAASAMVRSEAAADLPTHPLSAPERLLVILVDAGLASSRSEARRLVAQGAVRIDGNRVDDPEQQIAPGAEGSVVRVGKKRVVRIIEGGRRPGGAGRGKP